MKHPATSKTRGNSNSNVDVDIISYKYSTNAEDDLRQIRNLFVDGMEINNSPAEYIRKSLQADLKHADSMNATYFSGRGEFLMLSEEEEEEVEEEEENNNSAILSSPPSNNNGCNNGDQGDSSAKRRRIRSVKGIVGLQDISTTTGTNKHKSKDWETSEHPNLCELRRMSIHSSCRRLGYGAKLVRECISHAKGSKFDGIKVFTGAWMEAAIGFYTKMGFEDKGRLEYANGDGSSVTLAHLELIF
mmetsp:Transcript_8542/g.13489  ORF Transcript_8542/g.13489 Transcript_8542/m.13489 type:complete len:245 (-) Transcript_8542:317-1051(-)|eukprot:CAMPEP_0201619296 /NCGR_PEP_ID=MMETSP0492-20130828/41226_1 /ASSEMBLY_ACC=CAM_ASM_000837 /TAXON_ID=420259 /ORGANISM="Thalassiosira gravida, Strain GMp14c1" /LENGTH=244 /DNA_ID=CAMNT_0048088135 /DNA_START=9 /DNA_END=743 /DNA_ORIENTATION=+